MSLHTSGFGRQASQLQIDVLIDQHILRLSSRPQAPLALRVKRPAIGLILRRLAPRCD